MSRRAGAGRPRYTGGSMKVLLFGATGTAGSGVLRACLRHPTLTGLRVVGRRPLTLSDSRVQIYVHDDYLRYDRIEPACPRGGCLLLVPRDLGAAGVVG